MAYPAIPDDKQKRIQLLAFNKESSFFKGFEPLFFVQLLYYL